MDFESSIDHFYTFDNVVIFPMSFVGQFPNIGRKIYDLGYAYSSKLVIFAAVDIDPSQMISLSNFDSLTLIGFAVVDITTSTVGRFYFTMVNNDTKRKILDVIILSLHGNVFANVYTSNPNFDVDAKFLVKYGFSQPKIYDNTVRLKYETRISSVAILDQINMAVTVLKTNVGVLKIFIPKVVAIIMSQCLHSLYEAGGNLSIVKYVDETAVLGVNSDEIVTGTVGSVNLPTDNYSPFVFHTHPDHVTRENKAYLAWPSGQDMMIICMSYVERRNQLVHFVSSPEGIWVIHLVVDFQKILVALGLSNSVKCASAIFEAVYTVFTAFETPRLASKVDAIERRSIIDVYLLTVKNYTMRRLISDVPALSSVCARIPNIEVSADPQLFNVSLVKWKQFSNTNDKGVFLTFDYFADETIRDLHPVFSKG